MYYYGARYYDPELGRFTQPDTIIQSPYDPQSVNRYAYCRNNPIKYIDPTGHLWWVVGLICAAIGGAIGGVMAAINHTSIWKGIACGFISGFCVGAGGAVFGFAGAVVGGAFSGGAGAAIQGGNIGTGALSGAIGAGIGCGIGGLVGNAQSNQFWAGLAGSAVGGALGGGIGAELNGGKFSQGATWGVIAGVGGYLATVGASKIFQKADGTQISAGQQSGGALTVDANADATITEYSRPLNNWFSKLFGFPRHKFSVYDDGRGLFEIENEPGENGSFINVRNLRGTEVNEYLARWAGQLRGRTVNVNYAAFQQRITIYTERYQNVAYNALSHNSNYAVNFVIYGRGSAPGGLGWCPAFEEGD